MKILEMLCNDLTALHAVKQVAGVWLRLGSDCKYITVVLSQFAPWGKNSTAFDKLKLEQCWFGYDQQKLTENWNLADVQNKATCI